MKFKENKGATEEDLKEFCKGQIAKYKIPKYWKFVDSFPVTGTGKIRKVEMREISSKELGLSERTENGKFEYYDTDMEM